MRVVFWGTYDTGKPRVRILMRGLRKNGVEVIECHREIWSSVEDKSQIKGLIASLRFVLRWLMSYPYLIYCYLRQPAHDAVLVGFMGHLDVLVLWPLAKLRRTPIVWDAFLSLYNTVVEDRRLVGKRHPLALLLYGWEWLSCRASDRLILDTKTHAVYFTKTFHLSSWKVGHVFVGAETDVFHSSSDDESPSNGDGYRVLFYGQYIPLHGIETIVRAAKLCDDEPIHWVLIGTGQEEERVTRLVDELRPNRLQRIAWVPYAELNNWIDRSDVCLGIFGDTDKAERVIPNKVFQILAAGKPLITRHSPAICELLEPGPGIRLIPPGQPQALAEAVRNHCSQKVQIGAAQLRRITDQISPAAVGRQLLTEAYHTINR